MRFSYALALAIACGGCATSTGIIPIGPDTFTVSEMRAPALGGGPAAQRAVLAEASAFCAAGGRVVAPVFRRPDGDPYTPYYPTAYDATFRCVPPGAAGTEKAAGQ